MVNPGAFSGSRKEFLDAQKEIYAAAVADNHVADTIADIQRRYFKRFPISLPHNEEPSPEWLAQVDDDAPDAEIVPPDLDSMDAVEYKEADAIYIKQNQDLKARKEQIKRRLQYQYNKSRDDAASPEKGSTDPMSVFRAKLTGIAIKKPRQKTAYNLWGPEHRFFVDPVFEQRVKEKNVPAKNHAALRSAIYKELFSELSQDEQKEWIQRAELEHKQTLNDIEQKMKAPPSTLPEDRQRVIQSMPMFLEPILNLVADYTGWKLTVLAGGPEPADGGRLNMISIHSGVTSGSVKMNFGRSERRAFKEYIIPSFGQFLKKCYSIEECRARALPVNHSSSTNLATLSIEEEIDHHRFDIDPNHIHVAEPRKSGLLWTVTKERPSQAARERMAREKENQPGQQASVAPPLNPPVRFGPPYGRKKDRIPPTGNKRNTITKDASASGTAQVSSSISRDAGDQSAAIEQTIAPVTASTPSANPAASEIHAAPSTSSTDATPPVASESTDFNFGESSRQPSASTIIEPQPAVSPSRAPSMPPSRAPSPVPSPAPSPAHSRQLSPAMIQSMDPAPFVPPTSTNPASSSIIPAPSLIQPVRTRSAQAPEISGSSSPEHARSTAPATSLESGKADGPPIALPSVQAQAEERSRSQDPTASPLLASDRVQKRAISRPPGAVVVPNLSTYTAPVTRKRKGAEQGGETQSKKSRVSAPSAAEKRKAVSDNAGSSKQKKQKLTHPEDLVEYEFKVALPADSPPWVVNAVKLLASADLGAEWRKLVHAWMAFEHASDYGGTLKLGNQCRPQVVADWIQRARSPKYRPTIKNLKSFQRDFSSWWRSLQPDWRLSEGTDELGRGDGDWDVLKCAGQNGLLSVLAALFFWGLATCEDVSAQTPWNFAVDEVLYSIMHLI